MTENMKNFLAKVSEDKNGDGSYHSFDYDVFGLVRAILITCNYA